MAKAVSKAAPKPPTPEEIDRHIAALNAEASSTPAKPKATSKPTAKAAPAKPAPTATTDTCRWGHGRYYSPPDEPDCKFPKAPKKQLCGPEGKNHERAMAAARKAAKEAGTAKAGTPRAKTAPPAPAPSPKRRTPAKPKGTSAEGLESALAASVAAVGGSSGGAKRTVRPPMRPMGSGPVARSVDMPVVAVGASAK